jgi:hypothetical protein
MKPFCILYKEEKYLLLLSQREAVFFDFPKECLTDRVSITLISVIAYVVLSFNVLCCDVL